MSEKYLYDDGNKKIVVEIVEDFGDEVSIKLVGWVSAIKGRKFFKKRVRKDSLKLFKDGKLKEPVV
jgi:hypothetical protein